jgi:O-antigen/teichoic acid export membrane protein
MIASALEWFAKVASNRAFLGGISGVILVRFGSLSAGFAISVVLARLLGGEDFGTYVWLFSLATILFTPFSGGVNPLIVRETARNFATDRRRVVAFGTLAAALTAAFAVVLSGVVWSVGLDWSNVTASRGEALLATALLAVIALNAQISGVLQGLKHAVIADSVSRVLRQGTFVAAVLLWAGVLVSGPTVIDILWLHILAAVTAGAIGFGFLMWRVARRPPAGPALELPFAEWSKSVSRMSLIGFAQNLMQLAPVLMLGLWASQGDVGTYRIVAQTSLLLLFGLQSVNAFMAPRYASTYADGRMDKLQYLTRWAAGVSVAVAGPPALLALAFGDVFLGLVFGADFAAGAPALAVLVVGQCVNAACGPVASVLKMIGAERVALYGLVAGCACTLGMGAVLIPLNGLMGAAVASAIGVVLWNLVLWLFVYRRLGVDTSVLAFLHGRSTKPAPGP